MSIAIGRSANAYGDTSIAIGYSAMFPIDDIVVSPPPFESKTCNLCGELEKLFTRQVPVWSKFTHWFFNKQEKKRVLTVLACWRFGHHFLNKLPKDVLFIIISHALKVDTNQIRIVKKQCDDCTKLAVTIPQCASCFNTMSVNTHIDYVCVPDENGDTVAIDRICLQCKRSPVYVCDTHSTAAIRSCLCERCFSIGSTPRRYQ